MSKLGRVGNSGASVKVEVKAGAFIAGFFVAGILSSSAAEAPAWDWTGFYAGTHIGNAAVGNQWKSATGTGSEFPGSFTSGGIINGFQAGYNRQWGRWLVGVEAEATLADIAGTARCADGIYLCDTSIDGMGTLTLRGGYALDRFLVYGKAGGALLHEHLKMTPTPGAGQTETLVGKAWRGGWTVGAGLEYGLTTSLSAKVEYNFLEFTGDIAFSGNEGNNIDVGLTQQVHLIKVGLNTRLGVNSPFERPLWAPSSVPSTHDWTGLYVGVHAGGAFGTTDWNSADGVLGAFSTQTFAGSGTADGSILGAQVGYNAQLGPWVVGAELAASWANLDGYAKCATSAATDSYACHSRINSLYMATARLGMPYGNFLFYGLAGGAVAVETHDAYRSSGTPELSGSSTRSGYVIGSGVEYAFTRAFSGKVEYNFVEFGEKNVALSGATGTSNVAIGQNIHLVKFGLNYKLGEDPRAGAGGAMFAASPIASSGWAMETGLRYFYSNGKSQQDLYGEPGVVNSRLIYGGLLAHSAEFFARLDHDNGVFIKGNFGIGSITDGSLYDEDMPPGTNPYSDTIHTIRDSSMRYGSIDLGYNLINGAAGSFGPYVGYRYFYQRARGFGCAQVAQGNVCDTGNTIPETNIVLAETETWRGAAVGFNSRMNLAPRWRMEVDAAYLPYLDRAGVDNHWARADINPGPENGTGWGAQVEALLAYAVTPRFSVGVGARYWYFSTFEASTPFPQSGSQPLKYTADRYGTFLQASYKIGGTEAHSFAADEAAPPVDWTGFYAGGHLGAGAGLFDWSDPYPAPPTGDHVKTGGALGGAQLGYNAHFGQFVVGAELSGSFARLEGADTCFGLLPPSSNAGFQCENTVLPLGTVTGRLGYAFGRSMIYGRAGAAVARVNYTLNSVAAGGGIDSQTVTDWGWTVGGGLEHALNARWSVNVDYKYVDFGTRSVAFDVPAVAAAVTPNAIRSRHHLMTMGINYHFAPMAR